MSEFGFPKTRRLLTAADFDRAFKQAKWRASSKSMLVLGAANELGHDRIGFVIARKNVRSAVQRNRIKRVIREVFRHHSGLPLPADMVVIARKGLDRLDNQEICDTFAKLVAQLQRKR